MSNLTLSKIAFLTDGASRFALDNFDLGISSKKELRQYLDEYYRENIKLFKDIRDKKVEDIYNRQNQMCEKKLVCFPIFGWKKS